jgi:hypothetical protein
MMTRRFIETGIASCRRDEIIDPSVRVTTDTFACLPPIIDIRIFLQPGGSR